MTSFCKKCCCCLFGGGAAEDRPVGVVGAGGRDDEHARSYSQMDVTPPAARAEPPKHREARYEPGVTLHRNLQDPSVAFNFGGEVGTLHGPDSVGSTIVIDSVYTDEKGDLKYRVVGAKASCKVTILEKHFDLRPERSVFTLGEPVVRNNFEKKTEFNMKGSLGVVRPGVASTVAAVFQDKQGRVRYTLKGGINWLPEEKFVQYFTSLQNAGSEQQPPPAERQSSTTLSQKDYRHSVNTENGDTPLLPHNVAMAS